MRIKIVYYLIILSVSFVFTNCNQTSGGGEVLTPGSEDPYIIDAVLCTSIENNSPSGITTNFYLGERVYLWVLWANVVKDDKVISVWYDPDNFKKSEYSVVFQSNANRQISISYLDISNFATKGEWIVKLYLNNHFMRSYRFYVN
ncbi:MAG TPA: hypothetical protein VIR55_01815 [Ignavibacteria bacterium]|jgi:hypothetical protein